MIMTMAMGMPMFMGVLVFAVPMAVGMIVRVLVTVPGFIVMLVGRHGYTLLFAMQASTASV